MMFLSQALVQRISTGAVTVFLLILAGVMAAWVFALKRQIRAGKRIESALAASETKFGIAFRASPDGMSIVDLDTRRIVEVNERMAEATGYSRDELIGRTAEELGLLVDPAALDAAVQKIERTGTARGVEYQIRRTDGVVRTIVASAGKIDLAGRPAALWVYRDVTVSRALEAQLRQSQKMDAVGRLAAGVAHDFNNLLTVIIANCEVGTASRAAGDPAGTTLAEIRAAAERAATLTGQLLAFSRRQIVQPRVIDLNEALREVRPLLTRLIGEDIGIEMVLDPRAGRIEIDPGQLQQVFLNLAANARDAMPCGGRLTFATSSIAAPAGPEAGVSRVPAGQYVCLEVADSGAGIDTETRQHMFEPFYTTKDIGQGTGLGLATVRGIVDAAHGSIEVESEPGRGARFRLVWPHIDLPAAEQPRPIPQAGAIGGREYLMLVEDETDLRELLAGHLRGLGYAVGEARSGEDAMAWCRARNRPPDLLVTDIVMSGMNGRELAIALQALHPRVPVLYLSGYTDDAVLRRGVSSSGVHFLQKPFTLAAFAATVHHVLDDVTAQP